jgi:hypothetical protein
MSKLSKLVEILAAYLTTNWWVLFGFGAIVIVLGWKMNARMANSILFLAWGIFLVAIFRAPAIYEQVIISRVLWTGLIGSGIGLLIYHTLWTPAPKSDENQVPSPLVLKNEPIIDISYRPGVEERKWLPIAVPPKTTIRIVLIKKDRTVEIWHRENRSETDGFWPQKDFGQPEQVGIIHVSNKGNIGVFDAVIVLNLLLGNKQVPDGPVVRQELPPIDLPAGGAPQDFYVVNQSSLTGILKFSDEAQVQVQGERIRRSVKLDRRSFDMLDRIPAVILPAARDWSQQTPRQSQTKDGKKPRR